MNDAQIDISDIDKAALLAALFNNSQPLGMGFLQPHAKAMTIDEATTLLGEQTRFDYVRGRVMKVDLSGDTLEPWAYDRDNGQGAAQRVVNAVRQAQPA